MRDRSFFQLETGSGQAEPPSRATRREPTRTRITLLCEVRQGLQPWAVVRLEDLSEGGFRIIWPHGQIDPRQPLRVRLPGLQVVNAKVCWMQGKALGCAFETRLHVAVFEHLLRKSSAQPGGGQVP